MSGRVRMADVATGKLSEADFLAQLVATKPNAGLAVVLGWEHVHFRAARTAYGWRTPGSGSMAEGWPDLTLVRRDRLIFAELKSETGRVEDTQRRVLEVLSRVGETYVWRPSQLASIAELLR